jgi:short-subunit dehydrogenase
MTRAVVIVGATSGIGRALARACAAAGRGVVLAGRDPDALERIALDCRVRFETAARTERFEALDFDDHPRFVERAARGFGDGVEGFVLCHGEMTDEAVVRRDPAALGHMIDVNETSTISLLERAADHLGARGSGFLCALTSVAGVRGRPRNHVYGATKAAVSTYLEGLRARLARVGVSVVDVRPGIVDTAMTWGRVEGPLAARPERVARDVLRGIARDRAVVYSPGAWRLVMAVIRVLPDRIFNKLDL